MKIVLRFAAVFWLCLLVFCLLVNLAAAAERADPAAASEPTVQFARDVLPVLSANCFSCHGPDEGQRQADLRLDLEAEAKRERPGGAAVVAGQAAASSLIARLSSSDPDELMPPADSGKHVKPEQLAIIRRWIDQGAQWQEHWAFRPLVKPEGTLDDVVARQLASHALTLQPAAAPHTLARRLSLDLTGLPPTLAMADSLAADDSPEAYQRLVDELLGSPQFGEHWARMWLDLARYADTKGYEKDLGRSMWPYRDWVIDALNADMPLDQFTLEQLAGDLLPNPTHSQIIATAFHRNTMANDEGGTDDEEFRVAAVKDRVNTTVQVWMGLTMGCAQCHSHKYDPISLEDYYRFFAIFNQTQDADRSDDAPHIEVMTAGQQVIKLPIMRELPEDKRRVSRIHNRGSFLDQGDPVQPAVLAGFDPLPASVPADRRAVARWLVSPENRLTPRVWANRLWARLFGRGLVETEEDFGAVGSLPSQPELLEWLAVEYRDGGWSLKQLLRTIVLSETYRQASTVDGAIRDIDPLNALASRGARYRLSGEAIRDSALAVSGLLSRKMAGPPVMPPQPAGLWRSTYSVQQWLDAQGEDRFRRGLYTYLKRTTPYPSLTTFDAGSGELCMVRRIRTNTPLQALVTLNDPVFLEAAAGLAQRMVSEATDTRSRAERGLRLALLRPLGNRESEPLVQLHHSARRSFAADPSGATALIAACRADHGTTEPAEFAAWIVVANTILNLDEFLTRN